MTAPASDQRSPTSRADTVPQDGEGGLPHGEGGSFLRSISLSAILHMGLFAVILLVLLWNSRSNEWRKERRSNFDARLADPRHEPPPTEPEPVPEVVEEVPREEPVLVEQPEVVEPIPDDSDPTPEPLDWLPPVDPFLSLPAGTVIRGRPAPRKQTKPPPPPPPLVVEEPPAPPPPPPPPEEPEELVPVPLALVHPLPSYPRKAERLGWEGTVRLRIRVNEAGAVVSVEVVESSGYEILDAAAAESFREWVFCERQPGDPEVRTFVKPFTFKVD